MHRPSFISVQLAVVLILSAITYSQANSNHISIRVDASHPDGMLPPIWSFFGYDEPNYTYAPNGKKLLAELSASSPAPVYVRVHNLLTTGDGSGSLKWGSTNAYTEDASGKPVYDWTIVDRIFDTFQETRVKPLVELGFMPEALSTHPQPYRHNFPHGDIFTGWAYPPKDYQKWAELVFQFVLHLRERYGEAQVTTWLWEVWNEPDIPYWKGTPDEYFKLYDFAADAVLRALPDARVGGPDSTGPVSPRAAEFLRSFLEHCAHGKNFVSGKSGSRLDFISYHPKGSPQWENGHVRMGITRQLAAIQDGFSIVKSFPEWRDTPIVLGESDPEGCAACSSATNPQNSYRNGPLYAAYSAEMLDRTYELTEKQHINFLGAVTWAFEFEDQPPFAGFRELATNGIDKPVLNAFRMLGRLGTERLSATSSGSLSTDTVLRDGVRGQPDINVIAAQKAREIGILIWNYHDDDIASSPAAIDVEITGLPQKVNRVALEHFRVDSSHSNAFAAWKEMGSPNSLTSAQAEQLQKAGQLQLLEPSKPVAIKHGSTHLEFELPRQSLSLLRLSWSGH